MPVRKFSCPECETVLRPAKPLPSGKRVTCPKCKAEFVVRDPEEDEAKTAKPGKKSGAPATPKHDPFDEEGPGTYAVIKEETPEEEEDEDEDEDELEEEEEDRSKSKKPKKERARSEDLEFRLNIKVTDPRGPAQAELISPSNFLMLTGALVCIAGILTVAYGAWPFLFMDDILDPAKYFKAERAKDDEGETKKQSGAKKKANVSVNQEGKVELDKLSKELQDEFYTARDEEWWWLVGYMVGGGFAIFYNAIIIIGGVKMQNMESYTWSMVAAIMSFIPPSFPVLGQFAGLMALTTLRRKRVVDGFFYVQPSATPHKVKKRDVL